MTDDQLKTYDAAAAKLESILKGAFPEYKWRVPSSWDALQDEEIKAAMYADQLRIYIKKDGYISIIPCRTATPDDEAFAIRVGEMAVYALKSYRARQSLP